MDKNISISMLTEMYGKLLTDKQFDVVDLYYNNNLSLSEIAEELNITRQAVRKSLVEAEKNLNELEQKLMVLQKKLEREETINRLLEQIDDKELIELIESLR